MLTDALVVILKSLIDSVLNLETKSTLNYGDWHNSIKAMFESLEPKKSRKSKKDMMVGEICEIREICKNRDFFF